MERNLHLSFAMLVGEVLGRYRVVEPIGQGGMASVYAGEHVVLGHRVAIKVLHTHHLMNPLMERRFLNEARAVAAIRHPGIVELFDIGRAPDGRAYLIMELLQGESLNTRMQRGALPPERAVTFARQMAEALGAAHAHRIIHRDLKPDNVLIVEDGEVRGGERVKILDFGIAKRERSGTPGPEITATGVLIGTPEYMSPEQCTGDREIDARADIYSLGVVLYLMSTGRLPYTSSETGEMLDNHLFASFTPAPLVNDRVSPGLAKVIERCLAKDPEDRYPSMDAVSSALAPLQDAGAPVIAIPEDTIPTLDVPPLPPPQLRSTTTISDAPTRVHPLRRPRRAQKVWPMIAGAAALGIGLAVIWTWSGSPPAAPVEVASPAAAPEPEVMPMPMPEPEEETATPDEIDFDPDPVELARTRQAEPPRKRRARRAPPREERRVVREKSEPRREARPEPKTARDRRPEPKPKPKPEPEPTFDDVDTPVVF